MRLSLRSSLVLHALAGMLVAAVFVPRGAWADLSLNFGVYAADKPSAVVRQFRPVLSSIESSLSAQRGEPVKIRMQVAKSYEEGVQDLVQGRVDFSRFGPASYVEAKRRNPGLSIIAAEAKKGSKTFNGVICVRADSTVREVSDLKGSRFAFGNESSTIGRYLAQLFLVENGITVGDLAEYAYLERHDKVGAAVAAGSYDAGALKESSFRKLQAKGRNLRALASFPNVTKPWIARQDLDPDLLGQLRQALLDMSDPAAFKALKKDGFLPAEDSDYDRIRQAIDDNGRFFAR
jgi:phosphonate transport system substrate-binding protein